MGGPQQGLPERLKKEQRELQIKFLANCYKEIKRGGRGYVQTGGNDM